METLNTTPRHTPHTTQTINQTPHAKGTCNAAQALRQNIYITRVCVAAYVSRVICRATYEFCRAYLRCAARVKRISIYLSLSLSRYIYIYIYIYIYMNVYVYIGMQQIIYTYIYIYVKVCTHMHVPRQAMAAKGVVLDVLPGGSSPLPS